MRKWSLKIKRNKAGMSIIEIVVAMVLLMVAMMSLAFVYPKGRAVTDLSKLSMQATEIARSIVEEIKIRPIESRSFSASNSDLSALGLLPSEDEPSVLSIASGSFGFDDMNAMMWPFHHFAGTGTKANEEWKKRTPVFCWEETPDLLSSPASIRSFKDKLDGLGKIFFLPSRDTTISETKKINKGIVVIHPPSSEIAFPRAIPVLITVAWVESTNSVLRIGNISLSTVISENKYQ